MRASSYIGGNDSRRYFWIALALGSLIGVGPISTGAQVKLQPAADRLEKVSNGGSPTPAQLAEAIRTLPRHRILPEQESELIAEGQSSRIVQAGVLDSEGSLSNVRLTPPLSAAELDSLTGDNDPQIA